MSLFEITRKIQCDEKVRSTSQIKSSGCCGYDVTIRNIFRQGGFIKTIQEVNPDVSGKPADLSDEAYDAWNKVDANLETSEKHRRRNNLSSTDISKN
ncbi:hypothetical protein AVEN_270213-1 [Araneus ventricosus]|uniref:Uncharacterized protein n=1 Tax=Araneus ventricosus TaxID=182803 RepID=A0A4Y2FXF2_ARAVE|nr:hypothetical protein AVEN_270213-1 [Araneus ventricosus]